MKKSHIFGIIIIAVSVMIIIITAGDASTYVTFLEAKDLAGKGDSDLVHVVGQLKKDEHGAVQGVNSSHDKLSVTFTMLDNNNQEQKVYYNEPMPSDLLKSEQVVVVGSYKGDIFIADKVLLKCPSKYEEQEISM
jgi:cytochrome c-type biogenesis protein CcmE